MLFSHLFNSNIGGTAINDVALDFWHSGQNREDIGMEDLEHRLRAETMESQGVLASGFSVLVETICEQVGVTVWAALVFNMGEAAEWELSSTDHNN